MPEFAKLPKEERTGIFLRDEGVTQQITREEWDRRLPNLDPSLYEVCEDDGTVFSLNITHNLVEMAQEAELYEALWRPEEIGVSTASDLIPKLENGLVTLILEKERLLQFSPDNKWGSHDALLGFVRECLRAAQKFPSAEVISCR
ncbi:hypothetical protein AA14337_3218 [Acetobacter malorum DSM 14337]|uniref:DUF1828 domain-containing protein n=2 Tax=Acetobacter malorum TaxID=178901 RepID=A0ABQ0Q0C4_9PROT|nr:hypothetical protein AD930_00525 [Acetobacter malorum]GBQ86015.1 hypothetical protein AA14337_3218 [Acetobacter malorum DSM 14337]